MLYGIDVSIYQKFTSYDLLNDSNLAFVFIKASENLRQDPMYRIHNDAFARTKLLKGAYHFLRFNHNGVDQANAFINSVGPTLHALDLPPVLDIEDISENITTAETETIVQEWIDTVKAQYKVMPIIYTGAWYWNDKNRMNSTTRFKDCPLWVSAYTKSYPPAFGGWAKPTFWQYSGSGTIKGLMGEKAAIDLNQFLGDINALWGMLPANKPKDYKNLGEKLFAVQYMLRKRIDSGLGVDGKWGTNTEAALKKWQHAQGFAEATTFDPAQWQTLFELTGATTASELPAPPKVGTPVFPEPGVVTADLLNIRGGNGTTFPLISSPLPKGKSVTVLEENNGWYKVKTQIEGWVSKQHVLLQN